MADLGEAFSVLKTYNKPFQAIDYFFTQRTLTEEQEYLDKNMNRKSKKIKVTHNFLALNIPTINYSSLSNIESLNTDKPLAFDIEIYGDNGYHYKGTITSYQGIIPNFMVPVKGDKKLFVCVNFNINNNLRKFVNFIEVPKRYQSTDTIDTETNNDEEL